MHAKKKKKKMNNDERSFWSLDHSLAKQSALTSVLIPKEQN